MIKLISDCAHAVELADESDWDAIRWRTSTLLHAAPIVLLSKPKKHTQSNDNEKGGSKENNQIKHAARNQLKTAAGRERRVVQAFE